MKAGSPRALWVGVSGSPELQHLQAKVERAIALADLDPEPRKFKPHVTLARFRRPTGYGVGEFLQRHGLFKTPAFQVREFHLFSSILGRAGPLYRIEASYPLHHDFSTMNLAADAPSV